MTSVLSACSFTVTATNSSSLTGHPPFSASRNLHELRRESSALLAMHFLCSIGFPGVPGAAELYTTNNSRLFWSKPMLLSHLTSFSVNPTDSIPRNHFLMLRLRPCERVTSIFTENHEPLSVAPSIAGHTLLPIPHCRPRILEKKPSWPQGWNKIKGSDMDKLVALVESLENIWKISSPVSSAKCCSLTLFR